VPTDGGEAPEEITSEGLSIDHSWQGAAMTQTASPDHLDRLLSRTATGNRSAFRCLYAFLAIRVWQTATEASWDPGQALAITRSTFLDVWRTAGTATRYDARDWIENITAFRVQERQRLLDGPGVGLREPVTSLADRDERTHAELANVLGTGPAIIRVAAATFVRVEDLDFAVDAIAAAHERGSGQDRPDRSG
jgi:hypothetical protein